MDIGSWSRHEKRDGTRKVLAAVAQVFDATNDWRRQLEAIRTEAIKPKESRDRNRLMGLLNEPPGLPLNEALGYFDDADIVHPDGERNGYSAAGALVGTHGSHLVAHVRRMKAKWPPPHGEGQRIDYDDVASHANEAIDELNGATRHALLLKVLDDLTHKRVGERFDFDEMCTGWGLGEADIDQLWDWLIVDDQTMWFGGREIPVQVDLANRCLYGNPSGFWERAVLATSPLWGAAISFGIALGCCRRRQRARHSHIAQELGLGSSRPVRLHRQRRHHAHRLPRTVRH